MDCEQDKQQLSAEATAAEERSPDKAGQSRRQFARSAAVGGAVMLTLGNRAAWGQGGGASKVCVSRATFASYTEPGFVVSASANDQRRADYDEVEAFQQFADRTGQTPKIQGDKVCVKAAQPASQAGQLDFSHFNE
ncbi:hypothetical protein [Parahaliea mediterranea]|uniref:Uncharacterized protein n=1 Tax=Parahaliea mediterranea TaxID=651086 RepID=A0A939IMX7_9GAMM|nr:hypothetical protein [Parahaliea mediterranea]MBN7797462.1 hypothetical protein [Parahaliea mediterranea]